MAIKVGINGFGRIGRQVFHLALDEPEIEVVGINDLVDEDLLAHLLKYDSNYGRFTRQFKVGQDTFEFPNGYTVHLFKEKDPAALPWAKYDVDIVLESTGRFTDGETARKHIDAGAKFVVISAPGTNVDETFLMGVNHSNFDPAKHKIISNASCTTNCLAPVVKVLDDNFGVECGLMTTIHSYTNDQVILDAPHKDWRRARAAALNMIPTKTGAAAAIGLVLPHLAGKIDGFAVRVPTPTVSLVDFTAILGKDSDSKAVNAAVKAASEGELKGILAYCEDECVSMDFKQDPHSSIFDPKYTKFSGPRFVKVLSWYDNEWGYSARCVDLMKFMGSKF
ncbi:MAG: type I glyceraldehyde-3-phosphate dehydrogenase [bacterium]|jgi:glyceraldehyde 3-phosphate dehydrogenase